MAKTKNEKGYAGDKKVSLVIVVVMAMLVGVILGKAVDNWLESAYEIGESEGIKDAAIRGTQRQVIPGGAKAKPAPEKTLNGNTNQAVKVEQQKDVQTMFEAAVNQRNSTGMLDVMAEKVNFIEEATECCGLINKKAAVENFLSYSQGTTYFNFAETQQIVRKMRVNLPQSFSEEKYTKIGIGNDKKVAAYHVNAQNKVDKLYIAISHELFDLE